MNRYKYLLFGGIASLLIGAFLLFFQIHQDRKQINASNPFGINQEYLKHLAYIENLDIKYGVKPIQQDIPILLKQQLTLLPHLRPEGTTFNYNVPKDLHVRAFLLQQESNNLVQLRKDAKETQDRLSIFLNDFCSRYKDARLYIPQIKGMGTINNLLVSRWEGDASRITDYSRATISFPNLELMYENLESLKKSGLIILDVVDNFETPCLGGYRDIKVFFRDFVNGHIGELQLNIHSIMDFKNGLGKALFHVIRELMAIPKLKNRPLTEDEQISLRTLFEIEREGYDAALLKKEKEQKTIGVYSGSFDPPTKAHLNIILSALATNEIDKLVLYVNTMGKKKYQASAEQRKHMLELMLEDYIDRVSVYLQATGDKRSDYRKVQGIGNKLILIVGEDSYLKRLSLPSVQVVECDKIFVIPRYIGSNTSSVKLGSEAVLMPIAGTSSISSTLVREKLKYGEFDGIELDPKVLNYILSHNLYRGVL